MTELTDLYQEVVLDHGKRPRNFGPLEGATHRADGQNPLCGDRVTVWVRVEDGALREARFQGSGCAISTASASVMTGVVKGKTPAEVDAIYEQFHRLVTEGPGPDDEEALGEARRLRRRPRLPDAGEVREPPLARAPRRARGPGRAHLDGVRRWHGRR